MIVIMLQCYKTILISFFFFFFNRVRNENYVFPRRIFSSKKSARAKILTEWKTALKFIAHIKIKFLKYLRTYVCSVDF